MSEFTDRLVILLLAAVSIGSILVGFLGGFVVPSLAGWRQTTAMAVLGGLLVAVLIGIWFEFDRVETQS